jgi:predicted Zn finger-like uncharacterized protein
MSLITSCPACGTMFRVVPDQLKISDGWVRCGHCGEVFDATVHMADELPPVQQPLPTSAPAALAESEGLVEGEVLEPSELDKPFVFRRSHFVEDEDEDEDDFVFSVLPPPPPPSHDAESDDAESQPPSSWLEPDSEPHPESEPELADVSFVRQARRQAFWSRPLVRLGLTLASLLLAAVLLLQLAWHDRDRLATLQPGLRPALQQMCQHLQCSLGPPRQIESVVIESSGFSRLRNDVYRLSFGLRNTADSAVAAPAIELTLTDAQDQPLMRKVLSPAELGAPDNVIAGGAEWSGAVGIVTTSSAGPRVAGYRLLAFYP